MTSRQTSRRKNRAMQDFGERHAFDKATSKDGERPRAQITGNGTQEEVAIELPAGIVFGGFQDGIDAEIIASAHGADPHNKTGRATQPEKTRYKAKKGESGIQNVDDADERFLFTQKGHRVKTKKSFAITSKDIAGIFEVKDGKIYIRGDLILKNAPKIQEPPKFEE